ncbi:MAG TPA: hypothetical protein VE570_12220 [Thermoleophilaceae bacterium]|nr:hypothetical protein [Thermoleophilaceae bacterium]
MSPVAAVVRWLAIFATAFVALSFLFFAVNQTSTASQNQAAAISGSGSVKPEYVTKVPNPDPDVERLREQENDGFHEFVDDGDDVLAAPFTGIVDSNSIWVQRLVVLGFGLLIYGLAGLSLARWLAMKRV